MHMHMYAYIYICICICIHRHVYTILSKSKSIQDFSMVNTKKERDREVAKMIWKTGNRDPREQGFSLIGGTGGMK